MTMLERVAADMWHKVHWLPVMPMWAHEQAWNDYWPPEREAFRDLFLDAARAAITALMEPDEGQLRAGYEATHDPHATPAGGLTRWATWEEACEMEGWREERARAYRAMLKAALAEE
jgi:hypothetical protein